MGDLIVLGAVSGAGSAVLTGEPTGVEISAGLLAMAALLLFVGFLLGALFVRSRTAQQSAVNHERAAAANARLAEVVEEKNLLADQLADARLNVAQERHGIEALVKPVAINLHRLETALAQTEATRRENLGGLSEQLRELAESNARVSAEAAALKHVLRSSGARGRWGEVQLRRVVELSGMVQHVDFAEQLTGGDSGSARADLVVRLPGDISIAVDAKVPFSAYEQACESEDPNVANAFLRTHAKDVRGHVDALVKRAYWDAYGESPGFCVMFVPGDALLESALKADPSLWEYASRNRVLFATPTSLIALLRMAALGWARDSEDSDAAEVVALGRELHKRLVKALTDLDRVGSRLRSTVSSYNELIGSVDGRLMPQARRLAELSGEAEIHSLSVIDESPRDSYSLTKASES